MNRRKPTVQPFVSLVEADLRKREADSSNFGTVTIWLLYSSATAMEMTLATAIEWALQV